MKLIKVFLVIFSALPVQSQEFDLMQYVNFNQINFTQTMEQVNMPNLNFDSSTHLKQKSIVYYNNQFHSNLNTKFKLEMGSFVALEPRIDYDSYKTFCTIREDLSSKEVFFSAIFDYVLDKYVFGIFFNTPYNNPYK